MSLLEQELTKEGLTDWELLTFGGDLLKMFKRNKERGEEIDARFLTRGIWCALELFKRSKEGSDSMPTLRRRAEHRRIVEYHQKEMAALIESHKREIDLVHKAYRGGANTQ